ncbi:phosphotransferase [Arthrobacter sp. L77]|uniref:phosphotransferase n=1 Tax=Arthrobacter sp. L77 TaxID=1496689 RepID=UPI0005B8EF45|nr:phosphotransferase [Arthrobacter sp. L77]
MLVPDSVLDDEGTRLTIRRAWPHDDGRLTIEAVDETTGRLRAGRLDADGTVTVTAFGKDPALTGLPAAADTGELLVHRFTRRAVVRTDSGYLKVLPTRKAARVVTAHATAAELIAGAGIATPRVTSVDGGTLSLSTVPGTSLYDLGLPRADAGGEDTATVDHAWSVWADGWPVFAAAPGGDTARLPSYRPEDEARTLTAWMDRCLDFGASPVPDTALRSAVHTAAGHLLHGTMQTPVLSHRDLHDKQVLISGGDTGRGALGLIDCDTLARAEPALDLANLLVHLSFREAQGLLSASRRAAGERAILTVAEELQVPDERLHAYALSTKLRLACIYAFRPRWRQLTKDWFHDAP